MKEIIKKISVDTTSDGRDMSKYSINENGAFNKTELVIECVKMVVKDLVENKDSSIDEAVDCINEIKIHPQVVSTSKDAFRENRCKPVEMDVDGEDVILYVNNQWSTSNIDVFINGITELLENIKEINKGIQTGAKKIESIDIVDFGICLASFDYEVEEALMNAIKEIPEEEREDVVNRKWAEKVVANLDGGFDSETVDTFIDFYSMCNSPEMLVVNYENGDDELYGKYFEGEWVEQFNEIEGETYERSTANNLMRFASYGTVRIRYVPGRSVLTPEDEKKLMEPFDIKKVSYKVDNVTIDINKEEYRVVTSIFYDGIPFVPEELLDLSDWKEMMYYISVEGEVYSFLG